MMRCFGKQVTRGPIRWLTQRKLLAPLLVLAVLVCHGAYGAMHQVMVDPSHAGVMSAPGYPVGEHSLSGAAHEGSDQGSHDTVLGHVTTLLFPMDAHSDGGAASGIMDGFGHVAALLLLTSAAALLLAFAAKRPIGPAVRPPTGRRFHAPGSPRPRPGPSLACLQVLRL